MAGDISLTITAFNIKSLSNSLFYVNELLDKYNTDILCIAEHRLYNNELHKLNDINVLYETYGKASVDMSDDHQNIKPGHCGIALLWKKSLNHRIRKVTCESDRICVIEVFGACFGKSLYVIGVYLPHQTCKISDFKYHVNELSNVIAKCRITGEVIVIGDTNCHFGNEVGDRCWGKSTPNAKMLLNVTRSHGLKIIDTFSDLCTGPCYTFNVDNVGRSYIDHCIISDFVLLNVKECKIFDEEVNNCSDHLPIMINIKISSTLIQHTESDNLAKSKVAWHKISEYDLEELYTLPLHDKLAPLEQYMIKVLDANDNECDIEYIINKLAECMINQCNELPHTKFKKHFKPYWTEELTVLIKNNKAKEWHVHGCPRDGDLYNKYKQCKRIFRNAQKYAERSYEISKMEELTSSQDIDIHYFWHLVNKHKRSTGALCPLKLPNGDVITDANDIRNAWKEYFHKLYIPVNNVNYDNDFKHHVEDRLQSMELESLMSDENLLYPNITEDEFNVILKSLKNGKAPGWDCITAEHIKYGGNRLHKCICLLFKLIIKYECIPVYFKLGIIVPIPKGTKCLTNQDNYRGITLIPVFAKLFEKWIMSRVEKWAVEKRLLHKLQGAAQKKCSSLNTAWLIREIIYHNLKTVENVYVVLLDTRKAFDTVWQDGLFFKLFNIGISGKTWRILRKLFHNFKCSVQIGGKLSESFAAQQGIHQGAPMSMFLYQIACNELLKELNSCIFGANVHGIKIACPSFADDITLIAISKEGIQQLVSKAYQYSKKWRYCYNPQKCKLIVFGKKKNVKVKIGSHCIEQVQYDKHLGTILTCKSKYEENYIEEVIHSCKSICFATQALGSYCVPVTPISSSKLYWQICVPKLTYGMEVMNVSDKSLESLEHFHINMSKHMQGLPKQCANAGSLGTIGWKSLETHIDFTRLLFLWRILLLPMHCIYKEIMVKLFVVITMSHVHNTSPTSTLLSTCKKYGFIDIVTLAIESGKYMTLNQWKTIVKNKLDIIDLQRWKITCTTYKSLLFVNINTDCHGLSAWWYHCYNDPVFSRQNRTIVKLLLNANRRGKNKCVLCNIENDSACHILFKCVAITELRRLLWDTVRVKCPEPFVMSIDNMTPEERVVFILNGFNVKYTHEFKDIYDCLSNYVHKIYIHYEYLCTL